MLKKKITVASVVELAAIVTLQEANRKKEVRGHITLKINKQAVNIRFCSKGKGPYEMGVII